MNPTPDGSLLQGFVRGETAWEALAGLGAQLTVSPMTLRIDEPADAPVFEPSAGDVATGLCAHWAVGVTLRDWARVLLATSMIDLRGLEDDPNGEILLEAVWAAADGADIDERQLKVARQLASSS